VLTLLVGLVLVRVLTAGELRRTRRSGAPQQEQLARMLGTGTIPSALGLAMGLICAGEVLLEVPQLQPVWGLAGAFAAFTFRLCMTAAWLDALVVWMERLTGTTTPYAATMARGMRALVVRLLPGYAAAGVVIQVVDRGLTAVQLGLLYVGFVLVLIVATPLLHRLETATREPTPEEAALVHRLSAAYGLGIDRMRVEVGGSNALVAGAGPASRLFVGEQILAGPKDELAAVLAHEVAHRDRHHVAWRVGVTVVTTIAMLVAAGLLMAGPDDGQLLLGLLLAAVLLPLVRHVVLGELRVYQEQDADAYAASRVGAEPLGRFLARHDDGIPLGGRGGLRYRLRTGHPTLAERLAALDLTPAGPR
jgi:Zn-dependent protease with chaperone function